MGGAGGGFKAQRAIFMATYNNRLVYFTGSSALINVPAVSCIRMATCNNVSASFVDATHCSWIAVEFISAKDPCEMPRRFLFGVDLSPCRCICAGVNCWRACHCDLQQGYNLAFHEFWCSRAFICKCVVSHGRPVATLNRPSVEAMHYSWTYVQSIDSAICPGNFFWSQVCVLLNVAP